MSLCKSIPSNCIYACVHTLSKHTPLQCLSAEYKLHVAFTKLKFNF